MELTQKRCLPCEGGVAKLTATDVKKLLKNISEWQANEEYLQIYRDFKFRNY